MTPVFVRKWSDFARRLDRATARGFSTFLSVVFVLQASRLGYVLIGGETRIVRILPDDAFYYFKLAQNFAAMGRWTFDGASSTTGFHLLWAYFLSAIFAVAPGIGITALFLIVFVVGWFCWVVAAGALARLVVDCYGPGAILAVYAIFCGTSVFLLPSMGMEAAAAVMFSALLSLLLLGHSFLPSGRSLTILYLLGLGGMLSRSDFGVVAFGILAARLVAGVIEGNLTLKLMRPSLVAFGGSLTGLALILGHSFMVSGQLLQGSAEIKSYWSALAGNPIEAPLLFVASMFAYYLKVFAVLKYPLLVALVASFAASALAVWKKGWPLPPFIASMLIGVGYIVLYSHNSQSLLAWYSQAFVVPLVVGLAPVAAVVSIVAPVPAVVLTGLAVLGGFIISLRPLAPHQIAMRDAGRYLLDHREVVPVGSWNAGLIGYFSKRSVVNLDGLVNDDILPYATGGNLARYVLDRKLAYIVDYSAMFEPKVALRGGYADGILRGCLVPIDKIDDDVPASRWEATFLTVYRVDRGCLQTKLPGAQALSGLQNGS